MARLIEILYTTMLLYVEFSYIVAFCAPMRMSIMEKTWSNPTGKTLTSYGPIYAAERPFIWFGIDVGGRMAVIKLEDGSLFVHSPINLDGDLREELKAIGPVKHIVSPNYEHLKYAKQWKDGYPEATLYGCPGLKEKKPDIGYNEEIGDPAGQPSSWPIEIDYSWFNCETTPIIGSPFFNEVLFYHEPTKTVLTTDLFWNYPTDTPTQTKLWKFGMDVVYLPFYQKFMVTDPAAYDAAVRKVESWDISRIVPCHGLVLENNPKPLLLRHLKEGKVVEQQ